jgi:hypothetical protein
MHHLLAALFLLPSIAFAADPNVMAEKEARSYLRPCPPGPDQQNCLMSQKIFIEEYVWAKSGERSGQSGVADAFNPDSRKNTDNAKMYLGMPQNEIQSCAWRLVIVQYQSDVWEADKSMVRLICGRLDQPSQVLAMRRADQLLRELHTNPAREPAADWEPKIAGLRPYVIPKTDLPDYAVPATKH